MDKSIYTLMLVSSILLQPCTLVTDYILEIENSQKLEYEFDLITIKIKTSWLPYSLIP